MRNIETGVAVVANAIEKDLFGRNVKLRKQHVENPIRFGCHSP